MDRPYENDQTDHANLISAGMRLCDTMKGAAYKDIQERGARDEGSALWESYRQLFEAMREIYVSIYGVQNDDD